MINSANKRTAQVILSGYRCLKMPATPEISSPIPSHEFWLPYSRQKHDITWGSIEIPYYEQNTCSIQAVYSYIGTSLPLEEKGLRIYAQSPTLHVLFLYNKDFKNLFVLFLTETHRQRIMRISFTNIYYMLCD